MGRERRQPEGAKDQSFGRENQEAVPSADPVDGGKSLSQIYRDVCTHARLAKELSRKNELRWACEEYETSMNLISDAGKRQDLTDYYNRLLEKARLEIEKHHTQTHRKLLSEELKEEKPVQVGTIRFSKPEEEKTPSPDELSAPAVTTAVDQVETRSGIGGEPLPEKRVRRSTGSLEPIPITPSKTEPAVVEEKQTDETTQSEALSGSDVPQQITSNTGKSGEELPALLPLLMKKLTRMVRVGGSREESVMVAIAAIAIVLLLVGGGYWALFLRPDEKLTVTVPEKRIGDKVEYDVDGGLGANADLGVMTDLGFLKGLNMDFTGYLLRQVNETTEVKDGFDQDKDVLEEYLFQSLDMEGTVDLEIGSANLKDGELVTHQVDYTDLRTRTLVRYYLSNWFTIMVPDGITLKPVESVDKGTFYTGPAQSPTLMNFLDSEFQNALFSDQIKEGDSNKSEEYNLKWEACGTDTIAGYESLKITIEELESSDWFDIKINYWVSSKCPYPTKIELTGSIDTGELEGGVLVSAIKVYLGGSSKLDLRYTATLRNYQEGIQDIPYRPYIGNNDKLRHDEANFVDWYPDDEYRVPGLFGEKEDDLVSGFRSDFQARDAYDFAVNDSSWLERFITEDHDRAFAVEGSYSLDGEERPVWDLKFGYFESSNALDDLLDSHQEGRWALIGQKLVDNTTNTTPVLLEDDYVEILKPDRRNSDMREVVSLASAEDIFLGFRNHEAGVNMENAFTTINVNGTSYDIIDFNTTWFEWEANAIGPTAGILSQFLPDQFEIPTLLGYHIIQNNTQGERNSYKDAMISGETGMRLYVRYHEDNFL